ncbi:MAG: LysM peptidoglycan-binding domain-containing protein [Solirubrobacterales bacterium]|nr:LysM peptidoglycan-binding domain-containing protein [Solirubrobacterales bacterium]
MRPVARAGGRAEAPYRPGRGQSRRGGPQVARNGRRTRLGGLESTAIALLAAAAGALAAPASASASAPHVVLAGESLWSISAANNLTTRTVAAFNGISEDSTILVGQTIQVPTVAEGAAALANAGIVPGSPATSTASAATGTTAPAAAPSTYGLDPAAASSWEAMRQAALAQFGIDLYPAGPLSAYRTYEQQAYLYDLYLSGQGAPANPPGSSTHELGVAVDVADPAMRNVIDQIGSAYGWAGTIPSEWWHVAYLGG